jgi:CRISPR type I-E-associated protein CasB/Cse2
LAGGGEKADGFESFERHFRRLLACDSSDLPELADQLHRLFKRLERESIAIDFNQLLWNLRTWHLKSTKIKTDWASEFWTAPSEVTTPTV